jgi:hypothetical protein
MASAGAPLPGRSVQVPTVVRTEASVELREVSAQQPAATEVMVAMGDSTDLDINVELQSRRILTPGLNSARTHRSFIST